MPRLIPRQAEKDPGDDYLERVAKFVPVEILVVYTFVQGLFQGATDHVPAVIEFVLYGVMFAMTGPYLWRFGGTVPAKRAQVVLGMASFVVWTYGVSGVFFWSALENELHVRIMYPQLAGSVLAVWTLIVPKVFKPS